MPFFKKEYILRRHSADEIIDGHRVAGYQDIPVILDVQTLSAKEVVDVSGSRDEVILKTFGDFPVRVSKIEDGVRADQLLFDGRWYECKSSRLSENTILKHWTSIFELMPSNSAIEDGGEEEDD